QLETLGDQPAASGDYVLVRVTEISGAAGRFVPGKEYLVEVGGGTYPPELETGLLQAASGRRGTATLASGAAVTYEVVDVKRRRLPDLTNEFARTAAGVETVTVLRETLRERAHREAQQRAEQEDEQKAVDALLQRATIELPTSLVDHEVHHLIADLAESLGRRGITMERYLQVQEKTEEQLRAELRPAAEKRLRTQLALDELARLEDLQPTQEEMDREVENVARGLQQELARVREWLAQKGRWDMLRATLRRRKALAFWMQSAYGDPAASVAAVILAGGAKGKRVALPYSQVLIHQPWGGAQGTTADIDIQAKQFLKLRALVNEILAKHTGQPIERLEHDTDRDFWMDAQTAKEYGLVDDIMKPREKIHIARDR